MRLLTVIILIFCCWSCGRPYPEFESLKDGGHYQLHRFGEDGFEHPTPGYRHYLFSLGIGSEPDSALTSLIRLRNPQAEALGNGHFTEKVLAMSPGDSLSFILPYAHLKSGVFDLFENYLSLPDTSMCRLELSLLRSESESDYLAQARNLNFSDTLEELLFLEDMLVSLNRRDYIQSQGIFIRLVEKGEGVIPPGEPIALHYEGRFLNGEVFDRSPGDSALYFNLGDPGQVLSGLEIALMGCRSGDSIEVILPPHRAFGVRGGGSGKVPPNTPVSYGLRVLRFNPDDSGV